MFWLVNQQERLRLAIDVSFMEYTCDHILLYNEILVMIFNDVYTKDYEVDTGQAKLRVLRLAFPQNIYTAIEITLTKKPARWHNVDITPKIFDDCLVKFGNTKTLSTLKRYQD